MHRTAGRVVLFTLLLWMAAGSLLPPPICAIEPEWVMFRDPILPRPDFKTQFPANLVEVWLRALATPERDLRRRAALAIAEAHSLGLEGLDSTIEPLVSALGPDQPRSVRLAAAQALTAIDAQQAASSLFAALDGRDLEMAELVEPALARWHHPALNQIVFERLAAPVELPRWHILAIRNAVMMGDRQAVPLLKELVDERQLPVSIRLEAATALGKLEDSALIELATHMSQDSSAISLIDRLAAARMIISHRGEAAEQLSRKLALDNQPVVQLIALGHLFRMNPELVLPLVPQIIESADSGVRRWAADSLISIPSQQNLGTLSQILDDADPDLRRDVCDALLEFAADVRWHDVVNGLARDVLQNAGWRGQEQAILLLVTLDDKSVADQLLELLAADRAEVHITAAWGLSRLKVPATAEPILQVLDAKTYAYLEGKAVADRVAIQLSHLAQAMGELHYLPAKEVLEEYIPKDTSFTSTPRSAAIWAIGHLPENAADSGLIEKLRLRLIDVDSMMPESPEVRTMAAITLGRLGAIDTLPSLRSMLRVEKPETAAGYACGWAIHELTGEELPPIRTTVFQHNRWFLMPTE